MRKKKHPEHVNHERWLVSYADFITLLFAFFVVMFAVSQVDSNRVGRFTEAFSKAVGINVLPMPGGGLMTGGQNANSEGQEDGPPPSDLEGLQQSLEQMAKNSPSLQGLELIRRRNELVLRLPEAILFDAGDARPKAKTLATIAAIGPQIRARAVEVRVEGHTDDRPIATGRFRSNWELSTARAIAIMSALAAEGVQPSRLAVAGYGEFRPIADNASESGRRQNRRVDLVVTTLVEEKEPGTGEGPAAPDGGRREGAPAGDNDADKRRERAGDGGPVQPSEPEGESEAVDSAAPGAGRAAPRGAGPSPNEGKETP